MFLYFEFHVSFFETDIDEIVSAEIVVLHYLLSFNFDSMFGNVLATRALSLASGVGGRRAAFLTGENARSVRLARPMSTFGWNLADSDAKFRATTICSVRKDGKVAVVGDGQVSMGPTIAKPNAKKVRRVQSDKNEILVGFAGGTADAMSLLDRLEKKLDQYPGQLTRACVELAKDWRTEKYMRHLQATMIVTDTEHWFWRAVRTGSCARINGPPHHGCGGNSDPCATDCIRNLCIHQ